MNIYTNERSSNVCHRLDIGGCFLGKSMAVNHRDLFESGWQMETSQRLETFDEGRSGSGASGIGRRSEPEIPHPVQEGAIPTVLVEGAVIVSLDHHDTIIWRGDCTH
jgi:hypothetical protein